jgi:CheY-specific phosphatase CheX
LRAAETQELKRIVVDAAQHVLPACGLAVAPPSDAGAERPGANEVVAFMGFTGDSLRGTVAIAAPLELVRAAYPLALEQAGGWQLEVFDWAGEIANRLLGRIKHALVERSIAIEASTPRVMLGEQLRISRSTEGTVCAAAFPVGGAFVRVWFDASTIEDSTLLDDPAGPSSASEGDVLLFD